MCAWGHFDPSDLRLESWRSIKEIDKIGSALALYKWRSNGTHVTTQLFESNLAIARLIQYVGEIEIAMPSKTEPTLSQISISSNCLGLDNQLSICLFGLDVRLGCF
ncbi:hypothetical protein BpHYR1_035169 [Brachionus plicatilis]|uniref:Uncharacterized protein n=1 Tax=Brachionus plicatilis TaxID=10195 RepID=A0A3M7SG34_BRAPC|nr:hypothetical protein BpHYR1_035169 [Brachionus plicatilis]